MLIGGATGTFREKKFAWGGRLVTAGDGNMVSVDHMRTSTTSSLREHQGQATTTRGSLHRSRRRGRTNVRTYSRGRATADACGGRHDVPCRPQDRHALGEGRQANINPHAGGAPALSGDRGTCSACGHSAAAFRVAPCRMSVAGRGSGSHKALLMFMFFAPAPAALAALGPVRVFPGTRTFRGGPYCA